jgi:MFS family permease
MSNEEHKNRLGLRKERIVAFALVVTTFTYYFVTRSVLVEITNNPKVDYLEKLETFATFYAGVAISAITGAISSVKFVKRQTLLRLWVFSGILGSLLLILIDKTASISISILSFILGVTVGFGMPLSMAYFSDMTITENRGKLGGIAWFVTGVSLFVLGFLMSLLGFVSVAQVFAAWFGIILVILYLSRHSISLQDAKIPKLRQILQRRDLFLYLVPWIMFCLINWLEAPIQEDFFGQEFFSIARVTELAISSASALVGGVFADWTGRKRVAISGFVLLGVGYAILGIFPNSMLAWYLYVAFDSVAWGIFSMVFFIVLWGDLAQDMVKEKYYLVGGLPFLLSAFVQVVIEPYIKLISIFAAFSLASFFLFLAVIPLMYAPETLPEKRIRERELKDYIEKAKKIKEKHV